MKKILIIAFMILAMMGLALAVPFSPQGNIDLKSQHNMTNLAYFESFTMIGNIIMGGYHVTGAGDVNATNVNGNQSWEHQSYPAACSSGYAITALGDSATCTDSWVNAGGDTMSGPLAMGGNNVSGVEILSADKILVGSGTASEEAAINGSLEFISTEVQEPDNEQGYRIKFYNPGGIANDWGFGINGLTSGSDVWFNHGTSVYGELAGKIGSSTVVWRLDHTGEGQFNTVNLQANTTSLVCNSSNAGDIYYNGGAYKHYGCNSTAWNALY